MATRIVPGVQVEARFDVLPPLPASSGVVGIAAVVDRPPGGGATLTGVTKAAEVAALLGPGTAASAPELIHALGNGASEVLVAPVAGGGAASLTLLNTNGDDAVLLRARSNGAWANQVMVDVRTILDAGGVPVRAALRLFRGGQVVEEFPDLVVQPGSHADLFATINTRSAYVVAVDPGRADALPADGDYALDADGTPVRLAGAVADAFVLLPDSGVDPAGVMVRIAADAADGGVDVTIFRDGAQVERFENLVGDPDSERHLPTVLLRDSAVVQVRQLPSLPEGERLPAALAPRALVGGTSPNVAAYQAAIDLLGEDPRISLVLAAIEPTQNVAAVHAIHQALLAHAVAQADAGAPRIAFGAVTVAEQAAPDLIRDHAAGVRNRRFVLVSPAGAAGAVLGAIARTAPEISPTFKNIPLFGIRPARHSDSDLNRLLGPTHNVLVVQNRVGRGVVALRGLDTTGDQISVTRVADAAIREVKAIAENFIGELNTADARIALREQIVATFTRMERANQLVPSTDGSDPAFTVDVYSTQLDFAQGVVRIDIAVRPVRAIDFIYATIRVRN